jgi:hypothetical protein
MHNFFEYLFLENYEKYKDWVLSNYTQVNVTKHEDNYYGVDHFHFSGKYINFPNIEIAYIDSNIYGILFKKSSAIEQINGLIARNYKIQISLLQKNKK